MSKYRSLFNLALKYDVNPVSVLLDPADVGEKVEEFRSSIMCHHLHDKIKPTIILTASGEVIKHYNWSFLLRDMSEYSGTYKSIFSDDLEKLLLEKGRVLWFNKEGEVYLTRTAQNLPKDREPISDEKLERMHAPEIVRYCLEKELEERVKSGALAQERL